MLVSGRSRSRMGVANLLRRNPCTPVMARHRLHAKLRCGINALYNGRAFALVVCMRRVFLIVTALIPFLLPFALQAQETRVEEKPIIESVEISGVPESRISRDLRDRMEELVGQRFDQLAADEVAFEIQNRLSERISAIRQLPGSDSEHIKVVFELGNINMDEDRDE